MEPNSSPETVGPMEIEWQLEDIFVISEPFLSGLQEMGVQLLWDAEIFHPHAVFIAQKMLYQIMRICKKILKLDFFGHILFLLF